jgi:hypothetical protein
MSPSPQLAAQLRARLLAWDPRGIANEPGAQHEYDALIEPIIAQLELGPNATEMTAWLIIALETRLGLHWHPLRDRAFAAGLVDWWSTTQAARARI